MAGLGWRRRGTSSRLVLLIAGVTFAASCGQPLAVGPTWAPSLAGGWSEVNPLVVLAFGRHGDPADHLAALFVDTGSRCTATAVGPQVLLTAEHCAPHFGKIYFEAGGAQRLAVCTKARDELGYQSGDWALCRVSGDPLPLQSFESVSTQADMSAFGDVLLLSGFGLTGTLSSPGTFTLGAAVSMGAEDADHITTYGSQVMLSDSGGAAYAVSADRTRRFVIGVNAAQGAGLTSIIAVLSSTNADVFIQKWLARHPDAGICGYNLSGKRCL